MKNLKLITSIAIFLIAFYVIKSNTLVGIDHISLSDYPAGFGKTWIMFYLVICPAAICAALPFTPIILKKMFGEMGN